MRGNMSTRVTLTPPSLHRAAGRMLDGRTWDEYPS